MGTQRIDHSSQRMVYLIVIFSTLLVFVCQAHPRDPTCHFSSPLPAVYFFFPVYTRLPVSFSVNYRHDLTETNLTYLCVRSSLFRFHYHYHYHRCAVHRLQRERMGSGCTAITEITIMLTTITITAATVVIFSLFIRNYFIQQCPRCRVRKNTEIGLSLLEEQPATIRFLILRVRSSSAMKGTVSYPNSVRPFPIRVPTVLLIDCLRTHTRPRRSGLRQDDKGARYEEGYVIG